MAFTIPKMKWHGDTALKLIRFEAANRVDAAARFVRDRAKELVSRDQPVSGAGSSRRGLDPSQPGEPPKKVTGHLRMNIQKDMDRGRIEARVGTNVPYGKWLELGTRARGKGATSYMAAMRAIAGSKRMAARPWLRPTLVTNAMEIQRRFGIGVKI